MTKSENVAQVRRCNRLVIAHKVAGNVTCMGQCKESRNRWMAVARKWHRQQLAAIREYGMTY